MKKTLALLTAVLMLMGTLAGCAAPAATTAPAAPAEAAAPADAAAPAADAAAPAAEETPAREVLNIGEYDEEWVAADLIQGDTFYDLQMMMAEPLFLYNHDTGALEGCLATTPEFNEDGTVMTFEVPEGRTFASGATLDAEDVKASLEHGITDGGMSDTFAIIEKVEVDGNKVIVTMKNYSTALLILLVSPFFCVIDSDQLATMTNEELLWGAQPYGAYYIDTYTEGSGVVLKRNEGFKTLNPSIENKGAAYIPTINVTWYGDEFAMISAFESGELDFMIGITEDSLNVLGNNEDVVVNSTLPPMVRNVQMNTNSKFLSDKNVRTAISYLINRDEIVAAFGGDLCCTKTYCYITKNVMFHTEGAGEYFKENYAENTEKAMQLLKEAGWEDTDGDGLLDKNGEKMTLTFNTAGGKNETAALAIQIQLRKAGLDVNVVTTTESTQLAKDGLYDLTMCNYWWSEPARFLNGMFKDHNCFDETEYQAMRNEIETTTDNDRRFELVDEAQKYLMDQMVVLPLYTTSYMKIYRKDLNPIFIVDGMFTNDCK